MTNTIQRTSRRAVDGTSQQLAASVGRALTLLDAIPSGGRTISLSELARSVGLPKSTAFRLLSTLAEYGYVERGGNGYRIGGRLFELGNQSHYCSPHGLRETALPFLAELWERTHVVAHLAVLDGSDVLYLDKVFGHGFSRVPSRVGGRVPASCSGLGKAMLAHSLSTTVDDVIAKGLVARTPYSITDENLFRAELATARASGVAFDREEVALGLTCVAAPIQRDGLAVAAVSVAGPTSRFDPVEIASTVMRTAAAISDQLTA